jgi:hypothetical protein
MEMRSVVTVDSGQKKKNRTFCPRYDFNGKLIGLEQSLHQRIFHLSERWRCRKPNIFLIRCR